MPASTEEWLEIARERSPVPEPRKHETTSSAEVHAEDSQVTSSQIGGEGRG